MIEGEVAIPSREPLWSRRGLPVTVEDAKGGRRTINVATPFARVGSDERAEVVLAGADILPCHVYLHATQEGIYCLGLSASAPSGWLTPKRRIEIGDYCLKVAFDDDGPPPQSLHDDPRAKDSIASPLPRLRVRLTGDKKHAFELNLNRRLTVVGRQPPSMLCVHHPTMSRTHAVLYWEGQTLWAVDLLAANGMRREDEPLVAGVLAESQRISLGDVRCRFLGVHQMAAEDRIGSLRDSFQQELAGAAAAREVAEKAAAQRENELAEAADRIRRLEADLATAERQVVAAEADAAAVRSSAEEQLAALRQTMDQRLLADAAREVAENAAAQREHELAEAADRIRRLENDLATSQRQIAAAQTDAAAVRSSAEEQLAALRETMDQRVQADAAREVAEKAAAQRKHELAEAADRMQRLENDLATAERQLAAAQADTAAVRSSAEEQLAALRQTMDQRLQADAAREVAEKAAAQREHELAEAAGRIQRLEADLATAERQLAAAQADTAAARSSTEEQLATLRETMDQRLQAEAAREVAEKAAAQREHELAEAADRMQRLENDLATAERQLAAAQADTVAVRSSAEEQLAALRQTMDQRLLAEAAAREAAHLEQLANHQAEKMALQAATDERVTDRIQHLEADLVMTRRQLAAREIELAASQSDIAALQRETIANQATAVASRASDRERMIPAQESLDEQFVQVRELAPAASMSGGNEWAMEDRVIGRLLDFRAKRETARRRSLVWGIAACIALLVLGGVAAAGKAWSSRGQTNAPEASANVADPAVPSRLP